MKWVDTNYSNNRYISCFTGCRLWRYRKYYVRSMTLKFYLNTNYITRS